MKLKILNLLTALTAALMFCSITVMPLFKYTIFGMDLGEGSASDLFIVSNLKRVFTGKCIHWYDYPLNFLIAMFLCLVLASIVISIVFSIIRIFANDAFKKNENVALIVNLPVSLLYWFMRLTIGLLLIFGVISLVMSPSAFLKSGLFFMILSMIVFLILTIINPLNADFINSPDTEDESKEESKDESKEETKEESKDEDSEKKQDIETKTEESPAEEKITDSAE